MSTHESKGAIFASFAANVGVGGSKLVAFFITGASSLLAESVHSVADSSNQLLLLMGGKQSRRKPTQSHPFGFGRVHFLYAFIVAIVLFSLGGVFAIFEGTEKIVHPHPLESPIIAYIVLIIAMLLEGFALKTAVGEAKTFKPKDLSWWKFIRYTKSVNHVVLMLEDSAALIGLTFAFIGITLSIITDNPIWDGISTLMIGFLLVTVAAILFVEVKSLLIGESVDDEAEKVMRKIILSVEDVDHVVDLKTLYTGPSELFIAMKVTVGARDSAKTVARAIDEIEARLRQEFPIATLIYIEPDLYKTKREQKESDQKIIENLQQ